MNAVTTTQVAAAAAVAGRDSAVDALSAALEVKDSYTANHARSIAGLAVQVGRELDLPGWALEDLHYGGIFHDVGKIGIPDEIINKPGPLTDEEFEVIRGHPVMGAEILAPVPSFSGVRTIVRNAHENACRELEENAGIQFDPEVVEALFSVLSRRPDSPDTSS